MRLFKRIQIFALDVLDQRYGYGSAVIHIANHDRDFLQARQLGSPPAALARYDFIITAAHRPDHDWLNDALSTNRIGQVLEAIIVHVNAWLVLATMQLLHAKGAHLAVDLSRYIRRWFVNS